MRVCTIYKSLRSTVYSVGCDGEHAVLLHPRAGGLRLHHLHLRGGGGEAQPARQVDLRGQAVPP